MYLLEQDLMAEGYFKKKIKTWIRENMQSPAAEVNMFYWPPQG